MNTRVAVVDDDCQFTNLIASYLSGRGYGVVGYTNYSEARKKIDQKIDIAIIDIHLGDGDGLKLLTELKQNFPEQKQIIFTGDDSLTKRLMSFAKGADDYMKKPIFPSELEARVRRLVTASTTSQKSAIANPLKYTKTEIRILEVLLAAKGELVPLEILESTSLESVTAIYTIISRLRKKAKPEYRIRTSYGRGWYIEVI